MPSESDIKLSIASIMMREGGYVDDPDDRGGETNFGITLDTARAHGYLGDMRDMLPDEARAIYRAIFAASRIDEIPDAATFDLVADCCVMSGARGIRWLQSAIGVAADGFIGPHTLAALRIVPDWRKVRDAITRQRVAFYADIVVRDASQVKFLRGWLARAMRMLG